MNVIVQSSFDEQPIIACCTPRGAGSLALIRLSGVDCFALADSFSQLYNQKKLISVQTHTVHYGSILSDTADRIDTVLFIVMRAPHTFTGQDTLEITCHNNQYIIDAIINRAVQCGARVAHGGEFSKRAYENGKIDLIQAEAINELIQASSQCAVKKSLAQLSGSFSSWIQDVEKQLLRCIALAEAHFEFIDEEMNFQQEINTIVEQLMLRITQLKEIFSSQKHIREGMRIALIGSVNAGKSSLFNILLRKERAIVTPHPGTTRDTIEATIILNDLPCTLIDTAGFRYTSDSIERIGIEKSYEEAHAADIVLIIVDSSLTVQHNKEFIYDALIEKYKDKCIIVANKIDKKNQAFSVTEDIISISCVKSIGIATLITCIKNKINSLFKTGESPFLVNERHYHVLVRVEQLLHEIRNMLVYEPEYELISHHIRDALVCLTELTGKTISEKGLDAVFREFCVGK